MKTYLLAACMALSSSLVTVIGCGASEPETRATFHCLSVYWTHAAAGPCAVRYRAAGRGAWQPAQELWYDRDTQTRVMGQYRGSIVNLEPGTSYEVELMLGPERKQLRADTWREDFPVKKVIRVTSQIAFGTTEGGNAADGYVVYDGTGATIDAENRATNAIAVNHSFVILRGFTVRNAQASAIWVANGLSDVVIEGCDISGWGRLRDPARSGRCGLPDAGIACGSTNRRMILQRNRIHDPRYTSTQWNEDPADPHPRGPRGLFMGHRSDDEDWESNDVIRYNEFYGAPGHLFEDALGGGLNYSHTGFPGQDSDIYGNAIGNAADDLIEVDGGGMNVRIWGNRFDRGNVFVSLQSNTLGPTYIFRNVFGRSTNYRLRHEPWWCGFKLVGNGGLPTKTAARHAPFLGAVYVYHNTMVAPDDYEDAYTVHPDDCIRHVVSRNNIFQTTKHYLNDPYGPGGNGRPDLAGFNPDFADCSFDYDLANRASSGDSVAAVLGSHALTGSPRWHHPERLLDEHSSDCALADDSPGRNAGVALPNFNRGAADEGGAPDLGAQEFGSPALQFGIHANWSTRSGGLTDAVARTGKR